MLDTESKRTSDSARVAQTRQGPLVTDLFLFAKQA